MSPWLRRSLLLAVSFAAAYAIVRVVGRIDWSAVADGLGHLEWWQFPVLLAVLLVRQVCNASPLAFFISGLGIGRAVVNDLAAHLLAVVAPPPGDIVVRVAMFTSWGIDASRAIAGAAMNAVSFYTIRFAVPVLGVLLLLPVRFDPGYATTAALSALVALTLGVLVVLGLRQEAFARRLGHLAGRAATRVRSSVDPDRWATTVVDFRGRMQGTFAAGFPRAAAGLVALVVADATVLLLALRFTGVSADALPAVELYAAFAVAYPLTLFPFMGLGVLDATLLATVVYVAGIAAEPAAVAGLVVWRVYTLGGPVALGAGAFAWWRHRLRAEGSAAPSLLNLRAGTRDPEVTD